MCMQWNQKKFLKRKKNLEKALVIVICELNQSLTLLQTCLSWGLWWDLMWGFSWSTRVPGWCGSWGWTFCSSCEVLLTQLTEHILILVIRKTGNLTKKNQINELRLVTVIRRRGIWPKKNQINEVQLVTFIRKTGNLTKKKRTKLMRRSWWRSSESRESDQKKEQN